VFGKAVAALGEAHGQWRSTHRKGATSAPWIGQQQELQDRFRGDAASAPGRAAGPSSPPAWPLQQQQWEFWSGWGRRLLAWFERRS